MSESTGVLHGITWSVEQGLRVEVLQARDREEELKIRCEYGDGCGKGDGSSVGCQPFEATEESKCTQTYCVLGWNHLTVAKKENKVSVVKIRDNPNGSSRRGGMDQYLQETAFVVRSQA